MTRREFMLGATAAAASFVVGCARRRRAREGAPNLVLIVSDTLRADHLGCLGGPPRISPAIDALAEQGTVFENAISCSPVTAASHASLLTGTYQVQHGIAGNSGAIPKRLLTLAQVCRTAGYDTAAIVSNPVLDRRNLAGIERGFRAYNARFPSTERNRDDLYRAAGDTRAATLDWLSGRARRPFFLWVHFQEPHGPYEVPDASMMVRVVDRPRLEGEPRDLPVLRSNVGRGGIPSYQVLGGLRDPAVYRARYAARTAYVDHHIGQVLEELRQPGVDENTLIVLTSDHGELLGEHGYYFQHGITLLQPVLHVPLVFAGPGIEARGRVSRPVSNADVMPTVLDLLDLGADDVGEQLDGHSLASELRGAPGGQGGSCYAICDRGREWCVLRGSCKYTVRESSGGLVGRLTDLEEDPSEKVDLSARRPALAAELGSDLDAFMGRSPGLLQSADDHVERLDDDMRQRLRSLGYLD